MIKSQLATKSTGLKKFSLQPPASLRRMEMLSDTGPRRHRSLEAAVLAALHKSCGQSTPGAPTLGVSVAELLQSPQLKQLQASRGDVMELCEDLRHLDHTSHRIAWRRVGSELRIRALEEASSPSKERSLWE